MNTLPLLQAIPITCNVQDLAGVLKQAKPGSIIDIGNPYRARGEDRVEILSHQNGIVIHAFRLTGGKQHHELWLNGSVRLEEFSDETPGISADLFEVTPQGIILQGLILPRKFREVRGHHRGALLLGGENNYEVCLVVLS